ncbi:MAG: GAF domain-containing protein, partial [Chloroflexota bacterium]
IDDINARMKTWVTTDITYHRWFCIADHYSFKTQSIAAAPLIGTRDGKSKVYGLVEVLNQPGDQPFSEEDMVILKLFCRSVGDALAHIDQMKSDKADND